MTARLTELIARYDSLDPDEQRAELIAEMRGLGGVEAARALVADENPEARRVGARVMELLADPGHTPLLARLVHDPEPQVAGAARRALHHQLRTPEWHGIVASMLEGSDPELRVCAAEWLAEGRL